MSLLNTLDAAHRWIYSRAETVADHELAEALLNAYQRTAALLESHIERTGELIAAARIYTGPMPVNPVNQSDED